jgi:hypothetical protein
MRLPRAWHLRRRDLRFLGVVGLTVVSIGAYLATETGPPEVAAGGWRRIDRPALEARIQSGELSGREALWYHPAGSTGVRPPVEK